MEPLTGLSVITACIPPITALLKGWIPSSKLKPNVTKGIKEAIPLILGIVMAGLYAHNEGFNWSMSLVVGIASGSVASKVRNLDDTLIHSRKIIEFLTKTKK